MITTFPGVRCPQGQRREMDWPGLCAFLSPEPPPPFDATEDPGQPGWSPVTFRDNHRRKDLIEAIYFLTAEHDEGKTLAGEPIQMVSVEQALSILQDKGLACLIVTTKSHTNTAPHWRIVLPLTRPITLEERSVLIDEIFTWGLALKVAESKNAACFWYTTCRGSHEESGLAFRVEGRPINPDAMGANRASEEQNTHDSKAQPPELNRPQNTHEPSNARSFAQAALNKAALAISQSPSGGHHEVVARESYAIGGLVGGGYLGWGEAEARLLASIQPTWKPETQSESKRTIRGQLREGAQKPRSIADRPPPVRAQAALAMPVPTPTAPPSELRPHSHLRAVPDDASPLTEAIERTRGALLRANNGALRKIVANATTIFALDPRWTGVIAYQALADRVIKRVPPHWYVHDAPAATELGPWTDADTTRAQTWLSREYGLDLGAEAVNAAIQVTAERIVIDPLRDYFNAIRGTWDGIPRIDKWLSVVFNAPNNTYSSAIGSRWLISCVARALSPGCQVDHVLVLEGLQGKGKSTALRKLCPSDELFFDSDLTLGDKDAYQVLRGKWIIELGELGALNRHEIQIVKAFVTRRIDTYRPSFGRRPIDSPRRFAFSGSTNDHEYLRDPTGNRRWWPVKAHGPIDLAILDECRDQLWAEALQRFEDGVVWYLETDELKEMATQEQELRQEIDAWEERVGEYLAKALRDAPREAQHDSERCQCVWCHGVTSGSILSAALGIEWGKQTRGEQSRVTAILRGLGWVKGAQRRTDAGRVRPYFPPAGEGE